MKKKYYQFLWIARLFKVYCFYFKVKTVAIKESKKVSKNLLFIYSHSNSNRKDYDDEFYESFKNAKTNATFLDISEAQLNVFALFKNILIKMKMIGFQNNPKLLASLPSNNMTISEIQNLMHEFNAVVTFCDCFGPDHLLAKAANGFGKETYTMQHGFYWMSSHPRKENIAFKHFISDYMLAWGQATVDEGEIAGIDRNRFIIRGKFHRQIKRDLEEIKAIGIFLNASVDRIHNERMIRICTDVARAHDLPIIIYKHPSDNSHYNYERDHKVIEDNKRLLKASFRVFISSGVILDLDCSENIFFFDCEALPSSLKTNFCSFSNFSELSEFINSTKRPDSGNITYISEEYSSFNFLGGTYGL
jgi:hypothetical protein